MITSRITEEENSTFSHHYGDQCLVWLGSWPLHV